MMDRKKLLARKFEILILIALCAIGYYFFSCQSNVFCKNDAASLQAYLDIELSRKDIGQVIETLEKSGAICRPKTRDSMDSSAHEGFYCNKGNPPFLEWQIIIDRTEAKAPWISKVYTSRSTF